MLSCAPALRAIVVVSLLISLLAGSAASSELEDAYKKYRAELEEMKEAYQLDSSLTEQVLSAGLNVDRLIDLPQRYTLEDAQFFADIEHGVGQILAGHAYESLGAEYTEEAIKSYKHSIRLSNPKGSNRGIVTRALLALLLKDIKKNYSQASMIVAAFAEESGNSETSHDLYQALIGNLVAQGHHAAAAETAARCRELMADEFAPMCHFLGSIAALSSGDRDLAYELYEEGFAKSVGLWSDLPKLRDCTFYSLSSAPDFEELLDENPFLERIVSREKITLNFSVEQAVCSSQEWPFFLSKQHDGSYKVDERRRPQDQLFCPSDIKEAVVYRFADATVAGGLIIHEESCTVFSVGAAILLPRFPAPTLEDQLGRGAFKVTSLDQAVVTTQTGGSDYHFLVSILPQLATALSDMGLAVDESGHPKTLDQLRGISALPSVLAGVASTGNFHAGWLSPDVNNHLYKAREVVVVDWAFKDPANPYQDGVIVDGDVATQVRRPPYPSDYALPPQDFMSYAKGFIPTTKFSTTPHASTIVYVRPELFTKGEDSAFIDQLELLAEDRGLQLVVFEEDWSVVRLGKESPIVPRHVQIALDLKAAAEEDEAEEDTDGEMSFSDKAMAFSQASVIVSAPAGGAEAGVLFAMRGAAVVQFAHTFPDSALSGRIANGAGAEYWTVPSLVVDVIDSRVSIGEGAFEDALATVEFALNARKRRSLCGEVDSN